MAEKPKLGIYWDSISIEKYSETFFRAFHKEQYFCAKYLKSKSSSEILSIFFWHNIFIKYFIFYTIFSSALEKFHSIIIENILTYYTAQCLATRCAQTAHEACQRLHSHLDSILVYNRSIPAILEKRFFCCW